MPAQLDRSLYWSFFLVGFGSLTPSSSFFGSVDYFDNIYTDWHPIRWITIAYVVPAVFVLALTIWKSSLCRGASFVTGGFAVFTVVLALLPSWNIFMGRDHQQGKETSFGALLLSVAVSGITIGIVEGGCLGITLALPQQYSQAYVMGAGCSAFCIALLRVFTKAVFTDSEHGLQLSAYVFFYISMLVCLLCTLICYHVIMKHPLITDCVDYIYVRAESIEGPRSQDSNFGGSNIHILQKLKEPLVLLLLLYSTTLAIFPGVAEDVQDAALGDWYCVILVVLFSMFDFLGRSFPARMIVSTHWVIYVGILVRLGLIPLVILAVHYLSNPFTIGILFVVVGITNGYWTIAVFMMGHKRLQGYHESVIGGRALLLALFLGMQFGSITSLLVSQFA